LQPGGAAHAVADNIGVGDAQMLHDRRDVVGQLLVVKGTVDDVGGVAMALELDGDDLAMLGQGGQNGPPQVDGPEGAVEQQQRLPAAVDLVVHLQPVDRGVAALRGGVRHGRRRGRLRLGEAPCWSNQEDPGSRGHGGKGPSLHHHWGVLSYGETSVGNTRSGHATARREFSVAWRVSAVYSGG
jgi:hypothetical protein